MTPQQLRAARKARGITARHIASLLDVSPSYLHDMEVGARPMSSAMAARYEAALDGQEATK